MHPTVRVERLGPDDWETLRDLRLRSLLTDPDSFGSSWDDEHDGDETWWREWLAEHRWFVARDAVGSPVGLVTAVPPQDPQQDPAPHPPPPFDRTQGAAPPGRGPAAAPFRLNGLWVAPDVRGRGVARALVQAVVREAGGHSVDLTVVDGNTAARALFHGVGFRPTGERTPRERDPSRWNDRMVLTASTDGADG